MQFAEHVKWRSEKFGAVVFDTLNERVYVTNETGKQILELVAAGSARADIAARLKEEYEAEGPRIEAEAAGFLQDLISAGFLVETESNA